MVNFVQEGHVPARLAVQAKNYYVLQQLTESSLKKNEVGFGCWSEFVLTKTRTEHH